MSASRALDNEPDVTGGLATEPDEGGEPGVGRRGNDGEHAGMLGLLPLIMLVLKQLHDLTLKYVNLPENCLEQPAYLQYMSDPCS